MTMWFTRKKRVVIRGKSIWIKPSYTKVYKHKFPNGKLITVKSGTQIIDRFWGTLRQGLKHTPRQPGTALLNRKIRSIQWQYWHKDHNMWQATGAMVQALLKI